MLRTTILEQEHSLHLRNPLAFFDLETTGVNISKDRIVEIAILKALPNKKLEAYSQRINPQVPIPEETSMIHGIYDEDIKDAPTFKDIAKKLASYLEGVDLAGFNSIRFDVPMLVEEFLRANIDFQITNRKLVDAQRIFHMMEPRDLSAAYKFYCNEELENAHSADADTYATYRVLEAQISHYAGIQIKDKEGELYEPIKNDMEALHQITASKIIDLAGRLGYNAKGEEIFKFGKHRNRKIEDVLKKEPAYYDWIMKNDFPLDTKRKLTEIKLRNFNSRK